MFDLEKAIRAWRKQMLIAGIKTPELLDELESHLRDEVARQVRLGSAGPQAFDLAVRRLGRAKTLHAEFAKARAVRGGMQRLMGFVCAVMVGFILLMSGFTFFFIEFGFGEQIVASAAVILSLGVACRWRYVVPFLPALPNRTKRTGLAFACIVSGIVCSSFFAQAILPHFERGRDGQIPAIGFWLLFPIAVGFGLAGGIQEAGRRPAAGADS